MWIDAPATKDREGRRNINVAAIYTVGVDADGHGETLGAVMVEQHDERGSPTATFLTDATPSARGRTTPRLPSRTERKALHDLLRSCFVRAVPRKYSQECSVKVEVVLCETVTSRR